MKLSSQHRNLFSGMMLAVVAGLSVAPTAIALPTAGLSTNAPLIVAQVPQTTTATVLETDIRDDMVRVQLADGAIRTLSLAAQNIIRLGLQRGAQVTLNMNGTRVVSMTSNNVTADTRPDIVATVQSVDMRDDMVRVRLPNGSSRTLLLSGQDILSLGLRDGSEVTLNMDGNRILTMSRMVSVQTREPVSATIVEIDSRDDTVRVRLADGSVRNLLITGQDATRLGLRRGAEVMLGINNGIIVTMFMQDASAPVTEVR